MKISILTPSYNSGKYIERAIRSVLHQDYDDWEHIIVDGGSIDGTIEILKKYPHLNWISEPDKGQSDAMNKAFNISKGELIVYLNSDDWFEKNIFGQVIESFSKNSKTEMVIGNLIQIFPDQEKYRDDYSTSIMEILDFWPCRFPINPVSYFYKRNVQRKIGDFPIENHWSMDYWFILRAFKNCNFIIRLNMLLGYYFIDDNTKSSNHERGIKSLRETQKRFLNENPKLFVEYYLLKKLKMIRKKYTAIKIILFRPIVRYLNK